MWSPCNVSYMHMLLESQEEMYTTWTGDEEEAEDSRERFLEEAVFKLKS